MIEVKFEDPRPLVTSFAQRHPEVPELQFIRDDPDGYCIAPGSMGYTNFSYKIHSKCEKYSLFLKHGRDTSRMDTSLHMPLERRRVEYDALQMINTLIPGTCPKPYCLDMDLNIVVMEFMDGMKMFHDLSQEGVVDLPAVRKLCQLLAKLHNSTLKSSLTPEQWAELKKKFDQPLTKELNHGFMMLKCLDSKDPSVETLDEMGPAMEALSSDEALVQKAKSFYSKDMEEECLINADSHQLSMFMKDGQVVLFDLEFSFLGKRSLGVALPITGFIHAMFALESDPNIEEIKLRFKNTTKEFWNTYISEMPDLQEEAKQREFFSEVAGFLAIYTLRIANICGVGPTLKCTSEKRARIIQLCSEAIRIHEKLTSADLLADFFFDK